MAATRPLHEKGATEVRPAAFTRGQGRTVRPAFSAEGEPEVEEAAFGAEPGPLEPDGLGSMPEPGSEPHLDPQDPHLGAGDDGDRGLDEEALFVDAAIGAAEASTTASHAESVQMADADADVGPASPSDLQALIAALSGTQAALTEEAKTTAVTLAMAIAERVVREQVTVDSASLREFIEDALVRTGEAGRVRLYLAPIDLERMEELETDRWHEPGREVVVAPDDSLSAGDCRLEAPGVSMDGRLSSRIHRLATAARSALLISEEGP